MTRALLLAALLLPANLSTGLIELDPSGGEGRSDLAYYSAPDVIREAETARLAYVELLDVPWTRDGGTRKWDLMTGPDLALTVRTSDGYEYAESRGPAASDVRRGDFPLEFAVSGVEGFAPTDAPLVLYVSDYDRTGSDLMFRTAPFSAADAQANGTIAAPIRTWTETRIGTAFFEFPGWGPEVTTDD